MTTKEAWVRVIALVVVAFWVVYGMMRGGH
jgi:hypothetical protein